MWEESRERGKKAASEVSPGMGTPGEKENMGGRGGDCANGIERRIRN